MKVEKGSQLKIFMTVFITAAIIISLFLYINANTDSDDNSDTYDGQEFAEVTFRTSGNQSFSFKCRIAYTIEERQQGLMGVESLAEDEGMLFIVGTAKEIQVWMKNMVIPIDIIFIDANKTVSKVCEADIEPDVPDGDLTRYPSDGPVIYYVEINQGLALANGISEGTMVSITYYDE